MAERKLRFGLIINPVAGIGGPAALKGSDGEDVRARARAAGVTSKTQARSRIVIEMLAPCIEQIDFVTAPGEMGGDAMMALPFEQVGDIPAGKTTADDTQRLARLLVEQGVDVLIFAGGDGTARDIADAVPEAQVVLGIPAGVKMHSGVFANNPEAAGEVLLGIVSGRLTSATQAEVRDIDEQAFRQGIVKSRFYGELLVPEALRYIQQTKVGGKESDELVMVEIAADVIDSMQQDVNYVIGSGSTTAAVMAQLDLPNTLLGVDVIRNSELQFSDVTEQQLYEIVSSQPSRLVITVIGGQGHLFGRGNQQLSPRVIRSIGLDNIQVVATKTKLNALGQRPLVVDTGDSELDHELSGLIRITTGYEDSVLVRVS